MLGLYDGYEIPESLVIRRPRIDDGALLMRHLILKTIGGIRRPHLIHPSEQHRITITKTYLPRNRPIHTDNNKHQLSQHRPNGHKRSPLSIHSLLPHQPSPSGATLESAEWEEGRDKCTECMLNFGPGSSVTTIPTSELNIHSTMPFSPAATQSGLGTQDDHLLDHDHLSSTISYKAAVSPQPPTIPPQSCLPLSLFLIILCPLPAQNQIHHSHPSCPS